jgi:predicted transcriptional regulator
VIARAAVAGAGQAEIAQQLGTTQQNVARYLQHDPEVRSLLLRLKQRHEPRLDKLYQLSLDSLEADLGHSDADVRFRARQEVIRLVSLGEQRPDGSPDAVAGEIDLEQALFVFMQSKKKKTIDVGAE